MAIKVRELDKENLIFLKAQIYGAFQWQIDSKCLDLKFFGSNFFMIGHLGIAPLFFPSCKTYEVYSMAAVRVGSRNHFPKKVAYDWVPIFCVWVKSHKTDGGIASYLF